MINKKTKILESLIKRIVREEADSNGTVYRVRSKTESEDSSNRVLYANNIPIGQIRRTLEWQSPSGGKRYSTKQRFETKISWDKVGLSKIFGDVTVVGRYMQGDFSNREISNVKSLIDDLNKVAQKKGLGISFQ